MRAGRNSPLPDNVLSEGKTGYGRYAYISTSITILEESVTVHEAMKRIDSEFIVIHRIAGDGNHYFYAYSKESFRKLLSNSDMNQELYLTLNLHEYTSTPAYEITSNHSSWNRFNDKGLGVVVKGNTALGIAIADRMFTADAMPDVAMLSDEDSLSDIPMMMSYTGTGREPGVKRGNGDAAAAISGTRAKSPREKPSDFYFHAEMPAEVTIDDPPVILLVMISFEEIVAAHNATSKTQKVHLRNDENITVRIIAKKNLTVIGQSSVADCMPAPDQPQMLNFEIRGTDLGAGELWVVCCQGPVCIATIILNPTIVQSRVESTGKQIGKSEASSNDPDNYYEGNQVDVYKRMNGTDKTYHYVVHLNDIDDDFFSDVFNSDIRKDLSPIFSRLDKASARTPAELEFLMQDLRAVGSDLFTRLFPEKLQRIFWERRQKIDHMKFYCEEPFVPWELLYITEPGEAVVPDSKFLGELGLIRWAHGNVAPKRVSIEKGKAKYIAPVYSSNNLKKTKEECTILENLFSAQEVTPATRQEVLRLLGNAGSFDLLHFAGHGSGSIDDQNDCSIQLEKMDDVSSAYQNLTPALVASTSRLECPDGNRPLIMLNACQTDKNSYFLTSTAGFAHAFLSKKAGVFIGTLWEIEDDAASKFVAVFYDNLVRGKPVVEATRTARESIRGMKDATFLAYSVYADPFAKIIVH